MVCKGVIIGALAALSFATVDAVAARPAGEELVVEPGTPVTATIDGRPARLFVGSGRIDRLTLDEDYVAASGIRPATLMGRAELSVAGRREFKGHNRPLTFSVAGRSKKARAFWFTGAPDRGVDGSIGPFALPHERVTFALARPDPADVRSAAPLSGDVDGSGFVGVAVGDGGMAVSFDVEDGGRHPVASAAAGALIARTLGGQLSGPSWDVEVLMGVTRPVRLLTLQRPLAIGPLSFSAIAVRVRDRIDASGRGQDIRRRRPRRSRGNPGGGKIGQDDPADPFAVDPTRGARGMFAPDLRQGRVEARAHVPARYVTPPVRRIVRRWRRSL